MNIELLSFLRNNPIYSKKLLNIRVIETALEEQEVDDITTLVKENIIETFEYMATLVTYNLTQITEQLEEIGETREEQLLFKEFLNSNLPFTYNNIKLFVERKPISKQPELLIGANDIMTIAHNNSWELRYNVYIKERQTAREQRVINDRSKEILRDHEIAKEMKDVVENHLRLLVENKPHESSIQTKDVAKLMQTSISLNQAIGQQLQQNMVQSAQTQLQPLNATEERLQLADGGTNAPLTPEEIALAKSFERDMELLRIEREKENENNE